MNAPVVDTPAWGLLTFTVRVAVPYREPLPKAPIHKAVHLIRRRIFSMWPFKKTTQSVRQQTPTRGLGTDAHLPIQFSDDLTDTAVLKRHALQALCGAMMSVHSQCRSPHPFCGADAISRQGDVINVIAHATRQVNYDSGDELLSIYLVRAESSRQPGSDDLPWQVNYALSLEPVEKTPYRKMAVMPSRAGGYVAQYGMIANPVEGDYATGSLERETARVLYCNPRPKHVKWEHEAIVLGDDEHVATFLCFMYAKVWHVVDTGMRDGQPMFHYVARANVGDDPDHNFGIYSGHPRDVYGIDPRDDSEYAKVIRENCPTIGF
jgi:hypothetical protein